MSVFTNCTVDCKCGNVQMTEYLYNLIVSCLVDSACNKLRLNPSKSEFVCCATLRRRHHISKECFTLPDGDVQPVGSVRNLGAFFDSDMNMKTHVNRLVSSYYYQLRRIRSIRRSIPTTMAITLMNSFVLNRIDYCNSLFVEPTGLPNRSHSNCTQ